MVQSAVKSVPEYLASLPPERQAVIAELRRLILDNLPPGYEERMGYGMACYEIPLSRYPDTYNGQPLCYIGLAAQKSSYSLYLTGPYMYGEEHARKFREAWAKSGKKLDMGKSCVRFKRIEDLALDVLAADIASVSVDDYIRQYERVRAGSASGKRTVKAKSTPAAGKSSNKGGKAGAGGTKVTAKGKGSNKGKARIGSSKAAVKGRSSSKGRKTSGAGSSSKAGRGGR